MPLYIVYVGGGALYALGFTFNDLCCKPANVSIVGIS